MHGAGWRGDAHTERAKAVCRVVRACAAAVVATAAAGAAAEPLRAAGQAHPIDGTWRWTRPINSCTEVYRFRPDNTLFVTSGTKKIDFRFTITRSPVAAGFFEMQLEVVKDYGGMDCGNTDTDDTGKKYASYILFEPGRDMYISCSDPRLEACFGPLVRVRE